MWLYRNLIIFYCAAKLPLLKGSWILILFILVVLALENFSKWTEDCANFSRCVLANVFSKRDVTSVVWPRKSVASVQTVYSLLFLSKIYFTLMAIYFPRIFNPVQLGNTYFCTPIKWPYANKGSVPSILWTLFVKWWLYHYF